MKRILFSIMILVLCSCSKEEEVQPESNSNAAPSTSAIVYISSAVATPTLSESITLTNNTGSSADISGWTLGDINNPTAYNIPANTIMSIGGSLTFDHTTLGFQINDNGEILYLKNASGTTVDTWSN